MADQAYSPMQRRDDMCQRFLIHFGARVSARVIGAAIESDIKTGCDDVRRSHKAEERNKKQCRLRPADIACIVGDIRARRRYSTVRAGGDGSAIAALGYMLHISVIISFIRIAGGQATVAVHQFGAEKTFRLRGVPTLGARLDCGPQSNRPTAERRDRKQLKIDGKCFVAFPC